MPLVTGHHRADPPPSYAETFYPKFHFGWSAVRSVRVGEWKYIDAPKPELYDVLRDKGEQKNLVSARAPLAAGLARETQRTEAAFGPAAAVARRAPIPKRSRGCEASATSAPPRVQQRASADLILKI